jgi:bifunctional non-homologous end joining protein LigD
MPAKARVADKLQTYRAKRDFSKTAEPSGQNVVRAGWSYVIQKHAARRLHYDFRLELDGVLLSWAVPKGPSLKPSDRRLAARTEDHPIEYGDFEGIIPQGEYGGGAVIVWDHGSWTPEGDAQEAMRKGRLTFQLHGEKLRGRWHLVRTAGRRASDKENWLLFKGRDEEAREAGEIVESAPNSVVSGRSIEEVEKHPDRVWHSNRSGGGPRGEAPVRKQMSGDEAKQIAQLVAQIPTKIGLSNLEKVLYPGQGVTKGALIAYYATVAERMLAHAGERPLALVRCPEGRHKQCFFQKHAKDSVPAAVGRVEVQEQGGPIEEHMFVRDLDGLIALVQLGVLEIHTWGCHVADVDRPDQLVFDFDPDPARGWGDVVEAAVQMRGLLEELGLESFVKTTGGKGLHVVAPVARRIDWESFKGFAKAVAEKLAEHAPDRFVTNPLKKVRAGKIFVDYLRNGRGATAIAPYSTRAREGATVAMPLSWEELERGVDPTAFNVMTVPARLSQRDPWARYFEVKQSITQTMRRRVGLR